MKHSCHTKGILACLTFLTTALLATGGLAQTGPSDSVPRIYGLALDPAVPASGQPRLIIATDYGLLRAAPDGFSTRIDSINGAISTLTATPDSPRRFYLSGFGTDKKPLGLLWAGDDLRDWTNVNKGNVIRSLVISPLESNLMFAIGDNIRVSEDGGATWRDLDQTPKETFSIAASATDKNTLYAATMTGLMISRDRGKSWLSEYADKKPVTMVAAGTGNRLYTFVFGVGLLTASEPALDWQLTSGKFEDRYLLHLIDDPKNPETLYASADTGALLTSRDGGKTWISYEGSQNRSPARLALGRQLFQDNCQACHGVKGVGESPGNPSAKDEFGFKAPALNNDMHAWHHSDAGIKATIQNGSSRNKRMVAFKEILTDKEIDDILVYIKSLWSLRSLACQGGRHMGCQGQ